MVVMPEPELTSAASGSTWEVEQPEEGLACLLSHLFSNAMVPEACAYGLTCTTALLHVLWMLKWQQELLLSLSLRRTTATAARNAGDVHIQALLQPDQLFQPDESLNCKAHCRAPHAGLSKAWSL